MYTEKKLQRGPSSKSRMASIKPASKKTVSAYRAIAKKEVPLAPFKDKGSLRKPAVVAQMKALKAKKK